MGAVNGEVYRVHFKFEPDHPDGYYLKGHTSFEKPFLKTIFPPERIPVKVLFVEAPKVVADGDGGYTQLGPPSAETVSLSWEGLFEPTEDYVSPLP